MSSTSTVVSLLTMRCDGDGNDNPLGPLGKVLSVYSFAAGAFMTVVAVAGYYFNTLTATSAVVTASTGVAWMVGGVTGYLAISAVAFVVLLTIAGVAPATAWQIPKATVLIAPK